LKERRSEYEIFAPDQLPEQVVGKRVAVHLREGVRTGSSERVLHGEIVGRKGGAIELRTKEAEHGTWLAASEVQSVAVRNETRTAEKALDRMAQGWSSGWSETASFGPFVEENRGSFRSFSGDQFSAALKADPGKFANHWVTFHYRPRDFISDHGEEVLLRFDENPLRKDGRLGLYASHGRNYTEVNLKNLEFVSVYENPNQPGRTAAALVDAWKQERGGLAGNYRIPDLGKFHAPAPGPSDFFKSFEFGDAVIADVQEAPYKPRELIVGRVVSNGDYRKSISLYDEASGKTVSLTEGSIFHSLHVSPANASWKLEKFRRKFSNFNAAHIQEAISALLAPSQERHVLLRLWPDRGTAQFLYGRIEKLGTDPAQAVYVLTDSQGARHEIDFLKQESFEIGAPQVKAPHPESLFWGTGVRP
ncbi:MAG: hypothetical protein ACXWP5_13055, partial [Bdellovibrionota bacterium]